MKICYLGLILSCLNGCSRPLGHYSQPSIQIRAFENPAISTIQNSGEYKLAANLCQKKKYVQAISVLSKLSHKYILPVQTQFITSQIVVCKSHISVNNYNIVQQHAKIPRFSSVSPSRSNIDNCGPRALEIICHTQHIKATTSELEMRAHDIAGLGTSMAGLAAAAKSVGFLTEGVQVSRKEIKILPTPAIAWVNGNHYDAVLVIRANTAIIWDPNESHSASISLERLLRMSSGYFLLLKRNT